MSCVSHSMMSCMSHSVMSCVSHSMMSCVSHSVISYVSHSVMSCVSYSVMSCLSHSVMSCVSQLLEQNCKSKPTVYYKGATSFSGKKDVLKNCHTNTCNVCLKRPTTNKSIIYTVASKSSRNSLA